VTLVAALVSTIVATARAQTFPPPPEGGLNPSVCFGGSSQRADNGRLIGYRARTQYLSSIRPDGTGLRRVTRPPSGYGDFYPAASPDGRSIAFVRAYLPNRDARPIRLMLANLRTGRTSTVLPDVFDLFVPAWSPDGRWLTGGTEVESGAGFQVRRTILIRPDGTDKRYLDAGGYLVRNGSWSPNGRCFAGHALYQGRGPQDPYTADAGFAIVGVTNGEVNTYFPAGPCPRGWSACSGMLPTDGAARPGYMVWARDGRAFFFMRGLFREPPRSRGTWPDAFDVIKLPFAPSESGGVAVPRAAHPHLSPDGSRIVAYSERRKRYTIFRMSGRVVRQLPRFSVYDWAPAPRRIGG
jgi:Tol biopolymer transport system component